MKIKKYEGATEQAVVRQIRDELGAQAAIVSIKQVRARGLLGAFRKPRVEIMAAYEEPGEIFSSDTESKVPEPKSEKVTQVNVRTRTHSNKNALTPHKHTKEPESNQTEKKAIQENKEFAAGLKDAYKDRVIEEQADKIRMLEKSALSAQDMLTRLSQKLSATRHVPGKTDRRYKNNVVQVLFDTMMEQGVEENVADAVLDGLDLTPDPAVGIDVNDIVKMAYANIIKFIGRPEVTAYDNFDDEDGQEQNSAAEAVYEETKPEEAGEGESESSVKTMPRVRRRKSRQKPKKPFIAIFLGPTGVGKTTTIAKLSADFTLNKLAKVSLISADTYRIAAVEQLRTYADILGIELGVVYGTEDMTNFLGTASTSADVILVDTAGRSHKHEEHMGELSELLSVVEDCRKYLVLSLTTKFDDMLEIARAYTELTDFNIIFTKLDETKTIGSVLNLCYAVGKPVSYITFGQNVPDDIRVLQPEEIARAILCGI